MLSRSTDVTMVSLVMRVLQKGRVRLEKAKDEKGKRPDIPCLQGASKISVLHTGDRGPPGEKLASR